MPTLTISSDAPATARLPFKLTFTFSAPVTIPGPSGVLAWSASSLAKAENSTFTKVSATQYTVAVTPNEAQKGEWTLTVPAGAYKNASGNASNTTAVTVTQNIDTIPFFASFSAVFPPTAPIPTGPLVWTLRFSDVLDADLTADKLVVTSIDSLNRPNTPGTVSNLQKTSAPGAAHVYTFVYNPIRGVSSVTITLPSGSVLSGGFPNGVSNTQPTLFNVP